MEEESRGAAQGKEEARARVGQATAKVVGTSQWGRHQGRQTIQGATGAGRWSTRAWTALAIRGTDSREDTSKGGIIDSQGHSKEGSARVVEEATKAEEEATNGSRGNRAARVPWSGYNNKRRVASWR